MEQRLSFVTLGVEDVARSRAFYQDLGWTGQSPDGDIFLFQLTNGMVLGLWGRDKLATDSSVTDAPGWGGVTFCHLVGSPEEVDTVLAKAKEIGATMGRPPVLQPWGGYSGIFIDPDGHPWEVAYIPFWTLHDDGTVSLPDRSGK
jgi:predicted lactoylglutathione lyase